MLFTLKEVFTRPGDAARDYLKGKRAQYYNVFYLLLIALGLKLVVNQFIMGLSLEKFNDLPENMGSLIEFLMGNAKLLSFALIPLFAFHAWLLFRRLGFSFIEQLVIAGFAVLGYEIVHLLFSSFFLLMILLGWDHIIISLLINGLNMTVMFLYIIWVYYAISRPTYTVLAFGWRMVLFYVFCFLEIGLFMGSFIYYLLKTETWG